MKRVRIGTSGWSYEHWDAVFYADLPASKRLAHYAKNFDTVEVNTTFYHLPSLKTVRNWANRVPQSFCFSIKASRFITHMKRLKDCKKSLKRFYQQIRPLKKKLGPILFQLPPSFSKDLRRLESFLKLLRPKYRYVFEFRSDSWFDKEVYALLKKKNIALCFSDLNGTLSPLEETADFIYIRLHGPQRAYQGAYGKRRLAFWVKRIQRWVKEKKKVYMYFDNDEKGYAVQDAKAMCFLL